MSDYMVRATAADGAIRAFAVTSKELVEEAKNRHGTCPIMTAALGRLLSAGVMMGSMMKGEKDLLTLQIQGDGPGGGLTVTADASGHVKGYPHVAVIDLPVNDQGKLNVGGAMGNGTLRVIKDLGLKEPYIGQAALQTGEIAEDLTYYFAVSEQVPSSVGLGVLMNKDNTVRQAGGFIIQLMPFVEDEVIEKLEENLKSLEPVTTMLDRGFTPERMLEEVLQGFEVTVNDTMPVSFYCNCSKERVTKALISIGADKMQEMIDDGEPVSINCHFCNTDYTFEIDELKEIVRCSKDS
ncbi:MAG: Hsp33 family molecular chaperone HslO [Lachnospiraceae bacterium]|nr:Hsp33 family molecular chaperone HslO [Lachnospiraceae bacterium]MDY3817523.1 Hsp33 family molecular chaperone HslO [Lachnospiraceae bacterium]